MNSDFEIELKNFEDNLKKITYEDLLKIRDRLTILKRVIAKVIKNHRDKKFRDNLKNNYSYCDICKKSYVIQEKHENSFKHKKIIRKNEIKKYPYLSMSKKRLLAMGCNVKLKKIRACMDIVKNEKLKQIKNDEGFLQLMHDTMTEFPIILV